MTTVWANVLHGWVPGGQEKQVQQSGMLAGNVTKVWLAKLTVSELAIVWAIEERKAIEK